MSDRLDGGTINANQEIEKVSEKIKKALIREGEERRREADLQVVVIEIFTKFRLID